VRPVTTARGERAVHALRIARIDENRAERECAARGLPALIRRMIIQRVDGGPCRTAVARNKQSGRLDARIHDSRLTRVAGREVPYRRQSALVIIVWRSLQDFPRLADLPAALE